MALFKGFLRAIHVRAAFSLVALFVIFDGAVPLQAEPLEVPVMERADHDLDTCAFGEVHGLDPKGDGFLAVRSGPGMRYRMIDKLHSGDRVWIFDSKSEWLGVAYGVDEIDCSPIKADREYGGPGKTGWVHESFVRVVAG